MSPTIPPLSLQGLEFIKRAQGLALVPYRDESGLRVIGYGHVLNDYETFSHFTREVAETLLTVDLLQCQRELKRSLRVTLNQALNQQRFAEALKAWENIRSGREQRREECARFKACTD